MMGMHGLCTPNLVGSIQWHRTGEESGSGKKIWAGSGLILNTIHFFTKIYLPAGSIFMGQARIACCSTIIATNAGYRLTREEIIDDY